MGRRLVLMAGCLALLAAGAAAALQAGSGPSSPTPSGSPAEPKRGDTRVITYDPKAAKAIFAPGDEVFFVYSVFPQKKPGRVRRERDRDVLRGRLPIEQEAGFVGGIAVSRQAWDPGARVGVTVFRPDGEAARGAWHRQMPADVSPDSYAEMPGLNKLVDASKGKDVVFLAFAVDKAELLRDFLKGTSFRYEIVADPEEAAASCSAHLSIRHIYSSTGPAGSPIS